MATYLSRLTDSPDFKRLTTLKPDAVCPYLYYTISPYVYTLSRGGWFSWIKRTRHPTDREPPAIKNPASKKINRCFVNEVLVRCPNPGVNVIAGIGPWEKNAVAVRILYRGGNCPFQHRPGQQTVIEKANGERSLEYSCLFPETLLESMTAISLEKAMAMFNEGRAGLIKTARIINPCRYHHRQTSYDARNLLPDDCCPHVFQRIYPHILAVMYNAGSELILSVQHPENGDGLTLKLEKKPFPRPWLVSRLMDGFYLLSGRLFHPLERLDYTLTIRVLSGTSETGRLMRQGRPYAVNLRRRDFLCPAGFHAVYPYLLLAAAGINMEWDDASLSGLIPCPDCAGVIYGLRNHPDP